MVDTEVVEHAEIVPVGQTSIYASTDPQSQLAEATARAQVLVQVVKDQGLARSFGGGRPHVQVEGWQFLASQFGLIPDVEWTKELEDGWEARAALRRLSDGQVIAHGDAECRRAEGNWKNRDSYALRSMAQTRAVSKVCRIALSSVMVMAGFAATPAEEMDGVKGEAPSKDDPHCPACLAVNGELVGVYDNRDRDKGPKWKCKNKPEDCAGAEPDKNGKLWSWSGWDESWERSAQSWLDNHPEHGEQIETVEPEETPSESLARRVKIFTEWSDEERRQAYKAVMEELGFQKLSSVERADEVFAGMKEAYLVEFPAGDPERPF